MPLARFLPNIIRPFGDPYSQVLRIKERHLYQNYSMSGDPGVGKSILIRQFLDTAKHYGDAVVVSDPECEFVQEYYDASRGDIILNPKDTRMPPWNIFDEVTDEADAIAVATSQFPDVLSDKSAGGKFFHRHCVDLYAFLLAYGSKKIGEPRFDPKTKQENKEQRPYTSDLGFWLAHPTAEIDPRIVGSEHVETLSHNSAGQRAGILGTVNEAGRALRMMQPDLIKALQQTGSVLSMMPGEDAAPRPFVIREWCKPENRRGWIFITSTPSTQEALKAIQTMWADLIMLRLMDGGKGGRRVWIIFEELGNLNTMSQFANAVTRMRKRDNCLVAGFQSVEQVEQRYPGLSKTVLSAFRHKFIFATSENSTSTTLEQMLGRHEVIQPKKSTSRDLMKDGTKTTWSEDRRVEPLVMESEVKSLEDLECYYTQRHFVVKLKLPFISNPVVAPALIERIIPPMERRPNPNGEPTEAEVLAAAAALKAEKMREKIERDAAAPKTSKGKKTEGGTQVVLGLGVAKPAKAKAAKATEKVTSIQQGQEME